MLEIAATWIGALAVALAAAVLVGVLAARIFIRATAEDDGGEQPKPASGGERSPARRS